MGMRSWSIPAGQWFGINVRVHLTFFFLLLFVWMTESKGADPTNTFLRSLAFTGIVMAAVLAHELGHLAVSLRGGPLPRAIVLLPIGGLSLMESAREESSHISHHDVDPQREIRIALVGPMVNIALALGLVVIAREFWPQAALRQPPLLHLANLPRSAVWINLFIAGLNLPIQAYRGTAPALNDVAGGHVQLLIDPVLALLPIANAKQVKGLAVTTAKRTPLVPDYPTAAESGLPGMDHSSWYGVWGPKKLPAELVAELNTMINNSASNLRDRSY